MTENRMQPPDRGPFDDGSNDKEAVKDICRAFDMNEPDAGELWSRFKQTKEKIMDRQ